MPRGRPRRKPHTMVTSEFNNKAKIIKEEENDEYEDDDEDKMINKPGQYLNPGVNEEEHIEIEAIDEDLDAVDAEVTSTIGAEEEVQEEIVQIEEPSMKCFEAKRAFEIRGSATAIVQPLTPLARIKLEPRSPAKSSSKSFPRLVNDESISGMGGSALKRLPIDHMHMGTKVMRKQQLIHTPKTRIATLHERMMAEVSRNGEKDKEGEDIKEGLVLETLNENGEVECGLCKYILQSETEMYEHIRAFHKKSLSKSQVVSGTLLCAHPHCSASFPDVGHLIAHLVAYHNQQQYRIRKITFNDISKFDHWKSELERNSRCTFIGNDPPEELGNDVVKVQLFCEFCEDWRSQARHLNSDPTEKLPKLIVGCPAHFTATIDSQKQRVAVIGCFAHLGHFKKPSWTAFSPETHDGRVGATRGPKGQTVSSRCKDCDLWFRSKTAMKKHWREVHDQRDYTGKQPMIECGDPDCDVVCDCMMTLCEHVAEAHKREDLVVEEYKFNSWKDFETWRMRMETDTCAKFTKTSGRAGKRDLQKYYLCHLSGYTNRLRRRRQPVILVEQQRNRHTKKMGRYCTAFMNVKINKRDGTVTMKGCLGHFGHTFDVRRLPVPDMVKKEITDLLLKGCTEDDVVTIIRGKSAENERGYYLQRYEVRNVVLKLQREGTLAKGIYRAIEDEDDWNDGIIGHGSYRHVVSEVEVPNDGDSKASMNSREHSDSTCYHNISMQSTSRPIGYTQTNSNVPGTVRFRSMRTLSDIHKQRRPIPSLRSGAYMGRNMRLAKLQSPVEVVEYVDTGEYHGEGHIVEMREVDDVMEVPETVENVYFEDFREGNEESQPPRSSEMVDQAGPSYIEASNDTVVLATPNRKRVPLLKEPAPTGNLEFDQLMGDIKKRIDTISGQLKRTQDIMLAESLLDEVKSLEGRLVQGIGQTTVPQEVVEQDNWRQQQTHQEIGDDEVGYYEDYEIDQQAVSHEVEVDMNSSTLQSNHDRFVYESRVDVETEDNAV